MSAISVCVRLPDHAAAALSWLKPSPCFSLMLLCCVLDVFPNLLAVALVSQSLVSRLVLGNVEGDTHVDIADADTPRHDCCIDESQEWRV